MTRILWSPTATDFERLLWINAARDFQGIVSRIDCKHYEGNSYPTSLAGAHNRKEKNRTLC